MRVRSGIPYSIFLSVLALEFLGIRAHAQPLSQVREEKKQIQTLLNDAESVKALKKDLDGFTTKSLQQFVQEYDLPYKKKRNLK